MKPNMYASRALSLLPFGYTWTTRLRRPADLAYLLATSWLPALWLLWRAGDGPAAALCHFALGYMAFIAIYEIGYLFNDTWDASRDGGGRQRLDKLPGPAYCLLFTIIRLITWVAIGIWTGWVGETVWLAGYGALAFCMLAHNLVSAGGLRIATFSQLAILRFLLPVLAALPVTMMGTLMLVATLLYLPPRLLSYMESKQLLSVAERGSPAFAASSAILALPVALIASLLLQQRPLAELAVYFAAIHIGWWLFTWGRSDMAANIGRGPQS